MFHEPLLAQAVVQARLGRSIMALLGPFMAILAYQYKIPSAK